MNAGLRNSIRSSEKSKELEARSLRKGSKGLKPRGGWLNPPPPPYTKGVTVGIFLQPPSPGPSPLRDLPSLCGSDLLWPIPTLASSAFSSHFKRHVARSRCRRVWVGIQMCETRASCDIFCVSPFCLRSFQVMSQLRRSAHLAACSQQTAQEPVEIDLTDPGCRSFF